MPAHPCSVRRILVIGLTVIAASELDAQCPESVDVGATVDASFCLRSDGVLWGWGPVSGGQLGNGVTNGPPVESPISILSNVVAVEPGWYEFCLALKANGTVWAWGQNNHAAAGVFPPPYNVTTPAQVPGVVDAVAVASGYQHCLAVLSDGSVWSWGRNYDGELGRGFTSPFELPALVPNLSNVVSISCGTGFALAARSDGTVWSWGSGLYGALGTGTTSSTSMPTLVAGLNDVTKVQAGVHHALALKADGTVWSWGNNGGGALGLGYIGGVSTVPVQIPGLVGVTDLAADEWAMVRKSDGSVLAWGDNGDGQLGIGTATPGFPVPSPVQPIGLDANVEAIACGNAFGLAIKASGHVLSWGTGQAPASPTPYVPTEVVEVANVVGPCPAVTMSSITHSSLAGGVPITVTGENFLPTAIAAIGGAPISSQVLVDPETITGLTPSGVTGGPRDLTVTTGTGTSTLSGAVTYDHAVVNAIGVPQIGGSVEVRISSYPAKPLIFIVDPVPGPVSLSPFGIAGIGFSPGMVPVLDFFGVFTHVPDASAITDPAGQWSALAAIPNDPGLTGQTFYAQAFAFSFLPFPPNGLFFFTNTRAVTILP